MAEFKIAEGFVEVHLRDHTDGDLRTIQARLRAAGGAELGVRIDDQTSRGLRDVEARVRTWASTHGQTVQVRADTAKLEASMLAARKSALDLAEATAKLTAAQEISQGVAAKVAREELDEAEALKVTAAAARGLERAEIAQAVAARAAASAADHLAAQQRQLARDTELAAIADRLSMQRSAGNRRIYNTLLNDTRRRFGSLQGTAAGSFREIETLGARAFNLFRRSGTDATDLVGQGMTKLGEMGPMSVAGIAVAIAALPALAIAAGGAITLGLGAGLAGMAIMAASKNAAVQRSFTDLKTHVSRELKDISQPFVPELQHIAEVGEHTFDSWVPHLQDAISEMAPAVGHFVDQTGRGLERFGPMFEKVGAEFDPLIRQLGDAMPEILDNIARGIEAATGAAAGHEGDMASFAVNLSKIVLYGGEAVGALAEAYQWVSKFANFPDSPFAFLKNAVPLVGAANGAGQVLHMLWDNLSGAPKVTSEFKDLTGSVGAFAAKAPAAATAAFLIAGDLKKAGDASQGVTAQVSALTDALNRLFSPALAVYKDQSALKQGFVDLAKAVKASHGELGIQTTKSRAAHDAMAAQLELVSKFATDQLNLTGSMDKVRAATSGQIDSLYKLAGGGKEARAMVDKLALSLGMVPRSVTTKVKGEISDLQAKIEAAKARLKTVPASRQAAIKATIAQLESQVAAAKAKLAGIQGKTVTINMHQLWSSTGAYIGGRGGGTGRADGGIDFHRYAGGGVRHDLPPHVVTAPTVLYGEPETGGEAYIPLGTGKRQRSTELLGQVAAIFGLVLSKRMANGGLLGGDWTDQIEAYANGGLTRASTGGGFVRASISQAQIDKANRADAGAKLIAGITASMLSSLDKIQSFATKVNDQIKATFSGSTETKMLAWAKGIEKKLESASTAAQAIADKIKEAKDYAATTKTGMLGTATLSNIGAIGSAADIKSGLGYRLDSLKAFSKKLSALIKAGLNKTMLQQIIDAGPEEGGGIADMFLKDPGSIKAINDTQKQLDQIAGTIGNNAADAMYDSGKNAANGFLTGLTGQQDALNALMDKLGAQLAKGIAKGFGTTGAAAKAPVTKPPSGLVQGSVPASAWGKESVKGHASGGLAQAGELAMVNERGPELIRFGSTSRVFTAQDTAALAKSLGATKPTSADTYHYHVSINVNGALDMSNRRERERFARAMVEETVAELRNWDMARGGRYHR